MRPKDGRDAELWIGEIDNRFGVHVRMTQQYTEMGIITPMTRASARGGRNVYGARSIVELLVAKRLARDGMRLHEVLKVMKWLQSTSVKLVKYPDDTDSLNWYEDNGEFTRRSRDSRMEQEWWGPELLFSPFPDWEVASAYFDKVRGYPELPQTGEEWISYWESIVQLVLIRHQTGLSALTVVIPKRWISAEPGRFRRVLRWFNQVTGVTAEPVLRGGHDPLTTLRIIDVAMIKRLVADKLMNPPETEEEVPDE